MSPEKEKIKEVREFLQRKPQKISKRAKVIFDGKQYNIRIPLDFVKKSELNPEKEEFEFTLEFSEDDTELPSLTGELIEKEKTND